MQADRDDPSVPATKGSTIREFLLWHDRRYGHEETAKLAEGLSPDARAMIDPSQPALGILGATWYPTDVTHPMLDRVMGRGPNEGRDLAQHACREVAPRMIRGVYKMLFQSVATPELYAKHIGRMWRRLHNTGDRTMILRAPGEAVSRTENWAAHHPFACWLTIYVMGNVFEAMGFKRWSVERTSCVAHGGPRCETILRFKKS